jgi:hypothetical protein
LNANSFSKKTIVLHRRAKVYRSLNLEEVGFVLELEEQAGFEYTNSNQEFSQ